MEEEQEGTNNDLNNFLASTDIPVIFLDRLLRVKRYTPAISKIIKLISSDVEHQSIDMSQQLLDADLVADAQSVLENLAPVKKEIRINNNWYIRTALPDRTHDSRIKGVIVIYNNITHLKRAEEKLQKSEEPFRLLVANVKDYAIFTLDPEGRVETWNAGAEHMKGYKEIEIIGEYFSRFYTPEDIAAHKPEKELKTAVETGRTDEEGWRVRKDGSSFWASVLITALRDDNGVLRGFAKITRDITERKKKEKELEEKNAELERFAYTVSHDLKSPLVTVKTFLGYLEQDMRNANDSRIEQDMGYIRTAADKMAHLLDELLEMSRIGRMGNPPVNVSFSKIVEDALNAVAGSIAENGVEVKLDNAAISLYGDSQRLVEIWQNLIENAVKYIGDQKSPRIEVGAETRGEETVFFVCDNGIGIDPRYKEKIFGLFEKLDPKSEGTGLGLALIKRIIATYHGTIWVESDGLGKGACFRFTLPEAIIKLTTGENT
jgi:PAS domain S-box-containing protein